MATLLTHKNTDTSDTRQHGHIGCTVYMYVYRVVADSAYFMTCEEISSCANKKSAKMADPHRFTQFPKVTRDATSMNKNSQLPNNLSLPYEFLPFTY